MATMGPAHRAPNTSKPPVLTEEQGAVVNAVARKDRNAIVNAVAGSGKTRTALVTAKEWLSTRPASATPTPHVLLLAYNKRLAQDMLAQRDALMPSAFAPFMHIRTIHGLGHRYFGGQGLTTDRDLLHWTRNRRPPVRPLPHFGLVILDEAQDLTPELFDFLRYFLSLFHCRPQLLVLGDPFQLLYRFKGADEAFILEADQKFRDLVADAPFEHFRLSICFRITHEMAAWINENLNPNNLHRARSPSLGWFERHQERIQQWWGKGIRANPDRPPSPRSVVYYRRSQVPYAEALRGVTEQIINVFEKFDTESSAMLSPSITSNPYSPVRAITNALTLVGNVQQSWFIDDSREANDPSFETVRRNKRMASTIHKFKGRERDAIVLVGLDHFAELVERNDPRNVFNMFYVGATRAREQLLIVQWSDPAYATHTSRKKNEEGDLFCPQPCPVTRALEYCPYNEVLCEQSPTCLQSQIIHSVPSIPLSREDYLVSGAHTPQRLSTMENVSSIIGLAVEVRLQLLLDNGKLEVPRAGIEDSKMPLDLKVFLENLRGEANTPRVYSWAKVLEIATAFLTKVDQLYYRWRQVRNFERWPLVMYPAKLDEIVRNLVRLLDFVCHEGKVGTHAGVGPLEEAVVYEERLSRLRELRKQARILFHDVYEFDMNSNAEFVGRCSPSLIGEPDIIVLSKQEAERMQKRKQKDESKSDGQNAEENVDLSVEEDGEDTGNGVTLVEVKVTSKASHDHLLQIGCYGAMLRETRLMRWVERAKQPVDDGKEKVKYAKMFVAYASIGCLERVQLQMDSFEFLHRVGCRKINYPFDSLELKRPCKVEDVIEGSQKPIVMSQEMTEPTWGDMSQEMTEPTGEDMSQEKTEPTGEDISQGKTESTGKDMSQEKTEPT